MDPHRVAIKSSRASGFLSAGPVITRQGAVTGLTTAAAIKCGGDRRRHAAGLVKLAILVTFLHFVIVLGFTPADESPHRATGGVGATAHHLRAEPRVLGGSCRSANNIAGRSLRTPAPIPTAALVLTITGIRYPTCARHGGQGRQRDELRHLADKDD